DYSSQRTLIRENFFQLSDELDDPLVLFGDLLALEGRQASQLQIENRLRLNFGEGQAIHRFLQLRQIALQRGIGGNSLPRFHFARGLHLARKPFPRFVNRARVAYQRDDEIERIDGFSQALEDVRASSGLAEIILGAPAHNFPTEVYEAIENLFEVQDSRLPVNNCQVDDTKRRLHRRQLVELVQNDLQHRVTFELDYDAHAAAIRLI